MKPFLALINTSTYRDREQDIKKTVKSNERFLHLRFRKMSWILVI